MVDDIASRDAFPVAVDPRFVIVERALRTTLATESIPGGVVAVIVDGALRFQSAAGVREVGTDAPVRIDTLFRIGSTTKMLTAAALMSLVDDGLLDLHRPVREYVPMFRLRAPFDAGSVTVHHLLTMTSGLPDEVRWRCDAPDGLRTSYWIAAEHPLWSPPGVLYNYSNVGYSLAGLVAETIGGQPYEDVLHGRVFAPSRMTRSTFDVAEARPHAAVGHVRGRDGRVTALPADDDCHHERPAGFLFAPAADSAHFAEAMLARGGEMLTAASAEAMSAAHANTGYPGTRYGYGLSSTEYRGLRIVLHTGGFRGYSALWLIVPERNFGVVVLLNLHGVDAYGVARAAIDAFFPELPPAAAIDYRTPPSTWGVYEGTYRDPFGLLGTLIIERRDGELSMRNPTGAMRVRMTQLGGDVFVAHLTAGELPLTFHRPTGDRAEYLVTRVGIGVREPY